MNMHIKRNGCRFAIAMPSWMVAGVVFAWSVASGGLGPSFGHAAEAESQGLGWSDQKPESGRFVETERGFMVPYTVTIPGSEVSFTMQPVPGGTFWFGSSEGEEGHEAAESPRVKVQVPPFWIAEHEVTWGEYKLFMQMYQPLKALQSARNLLQSTTDNPRVKKDREKLVELVQDVPELLKVLEGNVEVVDAVTVPTPLYDPSTTYESGEDPRQPAVSMTQYAAKQYSKWLSRLVGHDYRLPTEVEWEYACRAGSESAFSFGDDVDDLGAYAWYFENADGVTHPVASKKPNPWGLYDMHGNVMEWVLDSYSEEGYGHLEEGQEYAAAAAVGWPADVFPRALRGGHWDADPEQCRCAARAGAQDEELTGSDPNLPRSPWWYADYPAGAIGFRLVRPVEPLSKAVKELVWEADVDEIKEAVEMRVEEGRGVLENVREDLPAILKQMEKINEKR